jgi:DNA-binding transcriptional ArsR family regulator
MSSTNTSIDQNSLVDAAECLRALGHPTRLRILLILEEARLTVGELAELCEIKSHVASEHLRLMMRCGFLSPEKKGQKTYYQISEPHVYSILACIKSRFNQA